MVNKLQPLTFKVDIHFTKKICHLITEADDTNITKSVYSQSWLAIGNIMSSICLSVSPTATLCTVALRVGVKG